MNWIELAHDAGSCNRFDINILDNLSIEMREVNRWPFCFLQFLKTVACVFFKYSSNLYEVYKE